MKCRSPEPTWRADMRSYTPGSIADWDEDDEIAKLELKELLSKPTVAQQLLQRIRDEVDDDEQYSAIVHAVGELMHLGYSVEDADLIHNARFLVDYKIRRAQAGQAKATSEAPRVTGEWVYYIQIRDTIKIGYTSGDAVTRCKALAGDRVLAVEPGSRQLESARHGQFRSYRANIPGTRERFYPSDELMDHIIQVREDWPELQVR